MARTVSAIRNEYCQAISSLLKPEIMHINKKLKISVKIIKKKIHQIPSRSILETGNRLVSVYPTITQEIRVTNAQPITAGTNHPAI